MLARKSIFTRRASSWQPGAVSWQSGPQRWPAWLYFHNAAAPGNASQGLFFMPGPVIGLDRKRRPYEQQQPRATIPAPPGAGLFCVVILWGCERAYKRRFSLGYMDTTKPYKWRTGAMVALCAYLHNPRDVSSGGDPGPDWFT